MQHGGSELIRSHALCDLDVRPQPAGYARSSAPRRVTSPRCMRPLLRTVACRRTRWALASERRHHRAPRLLDPPAKQFVRATRVHTCPTGASISKGQEPPFPRDYNFPWVHAMLSHRSADFERIYTSSSACQAAPMNSLRLVALVLPAAAQKVCAPCRHQRGSPSGALPRERGPTHPQPPTLDSLSLPVSQPAAG